MYGDTELISNQYYYEQNFYQETEHLRDFCCSHSFHVSFGSLVQNSTISDYDLGGEGDLFKAPEPIIEEPIMTIDPMISAISMISCGEDISTQTLEVANQNEQLLSDVFYECKKDILAKNAIETPLSDMLDIKLGEIVGSIPTTEDNFFAKSVSAGCLSSMEWGNRATLRPTFLDFPTDDFETVYGMRRSYSEGDIKNLVNNNNVNVVYMPHHLPQYNGNCSNEDRMHKLSRYRDKKSKRNFGRKIKYACRKALADNQPRFRGRFAKTEDSK